MLAGLDLRCRPAHGRPRRRERLRQDHAGQAAARPVPPDRGRILVDGIALAELDPAAWRARCTARFQDFARFELPAVRTVGLGDLPALDDEPAARRPRWTGPGAGDLPTRSGRAGHPVGTATPAGGLSGGQWQKLALGRAMMRDEPLLVVLDEPAAGLDAEAEHALFERYAEARPGGARPARSPCWSRTASPPCGWPT